MDWCSVTVDAMRKRLSERPPKVEEGDEGGAKNAQNNNLDGSGTAASATANDEHSESDEKARDEQPGKDIGQDVVGNDE